MVRVTRTHARLASRLWRVNSGDPVIRGLVMHLKRMLGDSWSAPSWVQIGMAANLAAWSVHPLLAPLAAV